MKGRRAAKRKRGAFRWAVLVLLTIVTSGCAGESGRDGGAAAGAPPVPFDLVPTAEIGCGGCSTDEQLSVLSLATDGEERIYVLDRFEPLVRVFDLRGRPISSFGRRGEGPGELVRPSHVFAADGRSLYVVDRVARRLLRYEEDGTVEREWELPHFPSSAVLNPASDRFVFVSQHEAAARHETGIYALDLETEQLSLLVDFDDEPPLNTDGQPTEFYWIAVSGNGSIAVPDHGTGYRVRVFAPDGRLAYTATRAIDRVAKTEMELARERAQIARESIHFEPDPVKLHYYSWAVQFDEDERLWVRAGRSGTEGSFFDVFDGSEFLGTVTAPPGIAERDRYAIANGHLVAEFSSDAGEDTVRVFRIVAAE